MAEPLFGRWILWRRPGGSVVPMRLLGDEAEREVAEHLARHGFDLVYQSRGSRGAFDLLATRAHHQLGVQVKRTALPIRFGRAEWSRMEADAKRMGWRWVVAAATPDGIRILDPARATRARDVKLDARAAIANVLRWLERPKNR